MCSHQVCLTINPIYILRRSPIDRREYHYALEELTNITRQLQTTDAWLIGAMAQRVNAAQHIEASVE
jgi:hypothetical protein